MTEQVNNGWVRLHRKIFENKLWFSEPFTKAQAWIDIFAGANHTDGSFWVRGIEVTVKRGQLAWSELTMAQRWGWSKNKVRRFLKWLETEQQIAQQKTYITTLITVKNYDQYQETIQQTEQQKDSRRHTNKNVKNDKKQSLAATSAAPMTLQDYVTKMRSSPRRYIQLIGEYADTKKLEYTTDQQWRTFTNRNLRAAKELEPFTDSQIAKAYGSMSAEMTRMSREGHAFKWGLETLLKYLEA
jgi:hypothetical protein